MELFEEYMRENPLSSNDLAELIEKLVSSNEYIQSKNQQDLLERELDHAPYVATEKTFREAVDSCIRASRKMRDKIQAVAPFYLGAKDAPAPTPKNRIEHIINPQQTGHCHDLENLGEVLKAIKPGTCPGGKKHIHALLKIITETIDNELDKLIVNREVNHTNTVYSWLIRYLERPQKISYVKHCAKIDDFIARIQKHFCELSDAFSELTDSILNAQKAKAIDEEKPIKVQIVRAKKPTPKPTRPGKRTPFMEKQLSDFRAYLEKNPVTKSYSKIVRARQFWHSHKAEYDKAAKSLTGYSDHKTLSRSV